MATHSFTGPSFPFPVPPDLLTGYNDMNNLSPPPRLAFMQPKELEVLPDWLGHNSFPNSPHPDPTQQAPAPGTWGEHTLSPAMVLSQKLTAQEEAAP